ncbi:hypothetical protein D3C87_1331490 [compost metagenome]
MWNANDYEHRLKPDKLLHIIQLSEEKLQIGDYEIEVEYQRDTIGKYSLDFDGKNLVLINKTTACLALESCGIPLKPLHVVASTNNSCTTGSGCC